MLYGNRSPSAGPQSIRELPLLEGEAVEVRYVPYDGLVPDTPDKGHLLILTNQRVISFLQSDGTKETNLVPLEELNGVSVKTLSSGLRHLSQGLVTIVIGIVIYFIVGYTLDSQAIGAAVGGTLWFVGFLFIARYFFWEEEGSVTFQGGRLELTFPYKSTRASADIYNLVNRFFQLKSGNHSYPGLTLRAQPRDRPDPPTPPRPWDPYDL